MSIEILPVGVTCNLRCEYCYEQAERDKQPTHKYHKEAVMEGLKYSKKYWQLFGGEPLLLHIDQLDELLKAGYDQWGYTGVQTNGTLITPQHLQLFQKYNTQVGISIDGPEELNDSRWAGTLEATRKATARSAWAIEEITKIAKETNNTSIGPTLIVTLHSGNVSTAVFPKFEQWLRYLDNIGVRFINFHFLEIDYNAHKWVLSDDEVIEVLNKLRSISHQLQTLKFLNFDEVRSLLTNPTDPMCVWQGCDPWSTAAVQGLNNKGEPSNCTRGTKDGIDWLPSEGTVNFTKWEIGPEFVTTRFHERQLALYVTPEEHGGCKGCRFWLMCQGYCPGTGLTTNKLSDWRTKSSHCQVLKTQFTEAENEILSDGQIPISQRSDRPQLEEFMYHQWSQGKECKLQDALAHFNRMNSKG